MAFHRGYPNILLFGPVRRSNGINPTSSGAFSHHLLYVLYCKRMVSLHILIPLLLHVPCRATFATWKYKVVWNIYSYIYSVVCPGTRSTILGSPEKPVRNPRRKRDRFERPTFPEPRQGWRKPWIKRPKPPLGGLILVLHPSTRYLHHRANDDSSWGSGNSAGPHDLHDLPPAKNFRISFFWGQRAGPEYLDIGLPSRIYSSHWYWADIHPGRPITPPPFTARLSICISGILSSLFHSSRSPRFDLSRFSLPLYYPDA